MSKKFRIIISLMIIVFLVVFFSSAFYTRDKYIKIYNEGVSLLETGNYKEAIECFDDIPSYTDYRDISKLLKKHGFSICPHCGSLLE